MKETLNVKLLFLYLARKIVFVLLAGIVGAVLFGGGYYLKNFVFAPAPDWVAESQLYLTYAPEVRLENVYINDYTWQTLSASDACLDEVMANLSFDTTKEYLKSVASAGLESDVRLVILKVTDKDPGKAVEIAHAYEQALVKLGERMVDVDEVQIFTSPKAAEKKMTDNRTLRMSITGAVVGAVFAVVFLLFTFAVDDSVFLPEDTRKRFGIDTLLCFAGRGDVLSDWDAKAAKENLDRVLEGREKVFLSDISDEKGCSKEDIKDLLSKTAVVTSFGDKLTAADGINENADIVGELKNGEGVILFIKAGNRKGKLIERAVSYLDTQKIPVLGCILYGTDKRRMLRYLGSRKQ